MHPNARPAPSPRGGARAGEVLADARQALLRPAGARDAAYARYAKDLGLDVRRSRPRSPRRRGGAHRRGPGTGAAGRRERHAHDVLQLPTGRRRAPVRSAPRHRRGGAQEGGCARRRQARSAIYEKACKANSPRRPPPGPGRRGGPATRSRPAPADSRGRPGARNRRRR